MNLNPIKQLGQNFLVNESTIAKIVSLCGLKTSDTVLEIGPGAGALTIPISQKCKKIVAVEIDTALADQLEQRLRQENISNVDITNSDILKLDENELPKGEFLVIGALPYNISKKIIHKLLTQYSRRPSDIYVILQKEVAESYCSKPPNATLLSSTANIYCKKIEYLLTISSTDFRPIPKVDSALVQFVPKEPPENHAELAALMKMAFNKPRKMIRNSLNFEVAPNNDPADLLTKRPAQLTQSDFQALLMLYNGHDDHK